jgi:hypothetical protein
MLLVSSIQRVQNEDTILTSTIVIYSIRDCIATHLEQPTVTRLARPIVSPMPGSTNTVADAPLLLPRTDGNNTTNHFVARNSGEGSPVGCQ